MKSVRDLGLWLVLLTSVLGQTPAAISDQQTVDGLRRRLDAIADDARLARGFVGAKVVSMDSGRTVYERNATKLFIPASNMKLLTALSAVEILGLDYRFETAVSTNGQISDGTLDGDLVVIGSGDPTIGARWSSPDLERPQDGDPLAIFTGWAARLKALGIHRISGSLRCDTSVFSGSGLGAGWAWDDLAWGYAAPASGLPFNENVAWALITAPAAGSPLVTIEVKPEGAPLRIDNQVLLAENQETNISARALAPGVVRLSGVKNGRFPATRSLAVDDPPGYFLHFLRRALEAQGIVIDGPSRGGDVTAAERDALTPLFIHESPDLRYALRVLLKVSQNFYAETLLRKISPLAREKDPEDGASQLAQVLDRAGIAPDEYVIADGSGLSRYNLVTPNALVTLLGYVYRQPYRDEFVGFLPVGGVDGTLRYRMDGSSGGQSQAKTGRLQHVRSLSGYVTSSDGETLAFAVVLNHFEPDPTGEVEKLIDAMIGALAAFKGTDD